MGKPFETEAALCAAFIAEIGDSWVAYPETQGWDILLVRKSDGFQIGVQAKLKLNLRVICQALEQYGSYTADHAGPDCRAVLVPETETAGWSPIVDYIGLTIIQMRKQEGKYQHYHSRNYQPGLPGDIYNEDRWHEWGHAKRYLLPDYVPDVIAGASGPRQLTHWKISAIKIVVTLEVRGYVARSDFRHLRIDHRRWLVPGLGWLLVKEGRWVAGPNLPNFKEQHPRVYGEIKADRKTWMLTGLPIIRRQAKGPA